MKIQCDVCDKEEASVYCTADEAALCHGCDHRVHHANKLASKHHRFSLLSPKQQQILPLCEICQEKRALLFCQQDRAILCPDCDAPIHSANDFTKKHDRFLLTGVKLSPTSAVYTDDDLDAVPDFRSTTTTVAASSDQAVEKRSSEFGAGSFTSRSISEYLMETLPGWHFEDFCDSVSPSSLSCYNYKSDEGGLKYSEEESLEMCVPQPLDPIMYYDEISINNNSGLEEQMMHMKKLLPATATTTTTTTTTASNKRWRTQNDDVFAVPQMSPPPSTATDRFIKRCRY